MANNNLVFNALLAGTLGGMISERWIESVVPEDYVGQRNAALSFAAIVDAVIPFDPAMDEGKARLILAIAKAVSDGRYITSAAAATDIARAVAALYSEVRSSLGAEVRPVGGYPSDSQIGYAAIAPSNVLTLVPGGHTPGVYSCGAAILIRVAGSGTVTGTIFFSAPNVGEMTLVMTAQGNQPAGLRQVEPKIIISNGVSPITLQFNGIGGSGGIVLDLYGMAELVSPLP